MSPLTNKNCTGDNMQPCLTPLPTAKAVERVPLCSTRHLAPLYVDLMTDTILLGIPLLLSAIQRTSLSTLSKAFPKSTKTKCKSERYSALCSMIKRVNVFSASRSSSEACLLTIYGGIKMVRSNMALEILLEIAGMTHIHRQLSQIFRLPILAFSQ